MGTGMASPAFGQTHLTFATGIGAAQSPFGEAGTVDSFAGGAEFQINPRLWLGVEGGVISGIGRGFPLSDRLLIIPVNLYRFFDPGGRFRPFLTFGYTSVMIVGVGVDVGTGVDVKVWRALAVRFEVRGFLLGDKSGADKFGMCRVGVVLGLGRDGPPPR